MKTTVEIPDALFADVKELATVTNRTFKELVEEGLSWVVVSRRANPEPFKLRRASFRGEGLQEGVREAAWEDLRALIYEGHGG